MRKNIIIISFVAPLFFLVFFNCQVEAIEFVIEDSPYYIERDLLVKKGDTLTVEPGVVIEIAKNASVIIEGSICIEGYPKGGEVIFKAIGPSQNYHKGFWQGIVINSGQENTIEYVVIQHAKTGIEARPDSRATIKNDIITQNKIGIRAMQSENFDISRNSFFGNFSDIVLEETQGIIESNFFQGSLTAITLKESYPEVKNNFVKQVYKSAILSFNVRDFQIEENWWGSADSKETGSLITQEGKGKIVFEPFLQEPLDLKEVGVDLKE